MKLFLFVLLLFCTVQCKTVVVEFHKKTFSKNQVILDISFTYYK